MRNTKRISILVLIFCAVFFVSTAAAQNLGRPIYRKDSLYHRILVYKRGSVVTLQFGRRRPIRMQSQVNLANLRQHMLEYSELTFCGLLYKPQPKKLLVLGLGGGVIPREMRYYLPDLDIDVVEIDPDVPPIAAEFFAFSQDDKLKVHIDDGRMFVKKQLRLDPVPKYDIIILDAFNGDYIPFHLMTKEFLEELKGVLADDGVVIANVFYTNRLFDAEFKTFLAVFGRCQVFLAATSSNAMLASPGPNAPTLTFDKATNRANMLQRDLKFSFSMLEVARKLQPNINPNPRVAILTDDRAPVNWLQTQPREK